MNFRLNLVLLKTWCVFHIVATVMWAREFTFSSEVFICMISYANCLSIDVGMIVEKDCDRFRSGFA